MKDIEVKSRKGANGFCKRHGITPAKLSRNECVSSCDENGFYKALSIQGIGRNLSQENPEENAITFPCSEIRQLRVIEDANGNPWFVGKDVAENLGYTLAGIP
jgi:hypothetical protein